MASQRMRRIDGSMREVLATAIAHDITDPELGFVTITAVETSGDLRHAKVFVSALGDETEQAEALAVLERSKRMLQHRIADQLRLKYTPVLEFRLDVSARRAMRLDAMLREPGGEEPTP